MDELKKAATECLAMAFKGGHSIPAHIVQAAVAVLMLKETKPESLTPPPDRSDQIG